MVKYGETTYKNATQILEKSFLAEEPQTYNDVTFITHELEYHWAMLLLHGDMYWLKGIPSDFNGFAEEYKIWEANIKKKFRLKKSYHYEGFN